MTGINGFDGNVNNKGISFNKNGVKNENAKPEIKETIDVTGRNGETKELGFDLLSQNPAAIYGSALSFSKPVIDKTFINGIDQKTLAYINGTSPAVAARISSGAAETFAALGEADNYMA